VVIDDSELSLTVRLGICESRINSYSQINTDLGKLLTMPEGAPFI
jgi:hypothetical protein